MSLFGKSFDEQVAEAIEQVKAKNPGVSHLTAKVDGKTVTLSGVTQSPEAKGKVMQDFNALVQTDNTINMVKVERPAPAAAPSSAPMAESLPVGPPASARMPDARKHTVVRGETLSAIAKHYYGNANLYMKIFNANKDQLKDPDKIQVGQVLTIPDQAEEPRA